VELGQYVRSDDDLLVCFSLYHLILDSCFLLLLDEVIEEFRLERAENIVEVPPLRHVANVLIIVHKLDNLLLVREVLEDLGDSEFWKGWYIHSPRL